MTKEQDTKPTKKPEALAAEEKTRRKGVTDKVAGLAKKLGVGQSDPEAELRKRQVREQKRAENRAAKAKAEAKMTPMEKRKRLLLSRLNNPHNQYTREQIRQFKAELHAIKTGQWFEPEHQPDGTVRAWRVPEKPSNYDRFMAT